MRVVQTFQIMTGRIPDLLNGRKGVPPVSPLVLFAKRRRGFLFE
jgi:hypothetical protein